jgi:hypothetical protein
MLKQVPRLEDQTVKRREFIAIIGSASVWPLAAFAQEPIPVVGFLNNATREAYAPFVAAFKKGWLRQAMSMVRMSRLSTDGGILQPANRRIWQMSSCSERRRSL